MYVTACSLKPKKNSEWINCLAIGNSPDNGVITFILPNGKAFTGKTVWSYKMAPYEGCVKFELN